MVLTTHYMDEAQHLADRIVVIADGLVVAEGCAASIGKRATREATVRFSLPAGLVATDLPVLVATAITASAGASIEVRTPCPLELVGLLATWASDRQLDLPDLEVVRPTLEDIYLELTDVPQ